MKHGDKLLIYVDGELVGEATMFDKNHIIDTFQQLWARIKKVITRIGTKIIEFFRKSQKEIQRAYYEKQITHIDWVLPFTKQTNARRKLLKRRKILQKRLEE